MTLRTRAAHAAVGSKPLSSVLVDHDLIQWHRVAKEYLEFSAIAKDFYYYLKHPESFHYPLNGGYNTVLYRDDVPEYARPPAL